jgi:zinc transport system ATP-binding protein
MTPTLAPPLQLRGVVVDLGGRRVLQDVKLDVAAGEFVTLLGANGSGKSTLVRAAIGLVPLTAGTVELFGIPSVSFTNWRRLGYVPQRSNATSGVPSTVREVVMSGRLARRRLFSRHSSDDLDAVADAVERVGLSSRLRDSVNELSGGQQQRVLIARALAAQADLLVMDEPTAGVDFANQESLAELLGSLTAAGTSVLLVAHELGPLAALIDRAVVVRAGRIDDTGNLDDDQFDVHAHTGQPARTGTLSGEGIWR